MQSSKILRFAGDVSIDKALINNPKGFFQDIAAQVINIQFYEDLFSPFITGSLIVKESLDLVNLFPFIGEEFLELEITTPALDGPAISGKYYISNKRLGYYVKVGDTSVTITNHKFTYVAQSPLPFNDYVINVVRDYIEKDREEFEKKVFQNELELLKNIKSSIKSN